MKRLPSLIALLAVCCAAPQPASPPPAEEQSPPQQTAAPEPPRQEAPAQQQPPAQQEIYIDAVTAANPLIVRGRARTFENAVSLRVRDARGELITETYTTSVGEIGHHNPFEAQIWIVRDPGNRVTVEAFEYSAKDGSVRSLTEKRVDYAVETIDAALVFPKGDCTKLAPFTRRLPKSPGMARLLVEALLAGPTTAEKAAGASAPFPQGSAVRSVNLRDGVLTVDFNERLQNVGGSCAAQAIRSSVTQTLARLPAVKRVVIAAAGSEELALQP